MRKRMMRKVMTIASLVALVTLLGTLRMQEAFVVASMITAHINKNRLSVCCNSMQLLKLLLVNRREDACGAGWSYCYEDQFRVACTRWRENLAVCVAWVRHARASVLSVAALRTKSSDSV